MFIISYIQFLRFFDIINHNNNITNFSIYINILSFINSIIMIIGLMGMSSITIIENDKLHNNYVRIFNFSALIYMSLITLLTYILHHKQDITYNMLYNLTFSTIHIRLSCIILSILFTIFMLPFIESEKMNDRIKTSGTLNSSEQDDGDYEFFDDPTPVIHSNNKNINQNRSRTSLIIWAIFQYLTLITSMIFFIHIIMILNPIKLYRKKKKKKNN